MGYFDKLSIGDVGMLVFWIIEKIDLVVINGVFSFMEVLNNVFEELVV